MGQELIPILTPIAGVFVALFPLRLSYIEKNFDKMLQACKAKRTGADEVLQTEIKKKNPLKEDVLSFANQIATFTHIESDIKHWSAGNRRQVFLDIMTIAAIGATGVSNLDHSPLIQYSQLALLIAIIAGAFSGITFFEHFLHVHRLKSKNLFD